MDVIPEMAAIASGIEAMDTWARGMGNRALEFAEEAMILRIAAVEAVADMQTAAGALQSALGRLKAALADTPRHDLIRRRAIDGNYCKHCGGDVITTSDGALHHGWRGIVSDEDDEDHAAVAED